MGIGKFVRSLRPGDDHALAARDYAGQQSASDKAAARRQMQADRKAERERQARQRAEERAAKDSADRRRRHRQELAAESARTAKQARRDWRLR